MQKNISIKIILFFLCTAFAVSVIAQAPDLSVLKTKEEKIKVWLDYCQSLRYNYKNAQGNYVALQAAAQEGIDMAPATDASSRAQFFFFSAIGYYYQVKFDSAQHDFYQSLYEAQKANLTEVITNACVALIPVNFQLRQQQKVDSCKNILQSILDTTHDKQILQNGYSAMGSYYQQKSYYSTAQDYFLKSIELRKKQLDTTQDIKLKADYAIQCYQLSKIYQNTDLLYKKSLAILRGGEPYASASPPVYLRYLSSFTEVYSLLGNIDSALRYELLLEEKTKNSPVVPSEMISANLNIAKFYIDHKEVFKAFPYVNKADTLARKSKSPILIYQAQMWMGRYFEQTGKFEQAISLLTQALPVAKQINKEQYVEALDYMAVAQKGAGNLNEAIQYYEQHREESDSLTQQKISTNFADQETRYETVQKEQRIVSLNKENTLNILELQNATRTRLLLILGLAALAIISFLLYLFYRNKEKLNNLLNRQNIQLETLNNQLGVANETKAKLFAIIGHDLRSPIGQIVQLMQLQKEHASLLSDEERQAHDARLKKDSENVLQTMEDLLLWSKSQMEHFVPQYNSVNISTLIKKQTVLLAKQAENKKLKISDQTDANFIKNTDENFLIVVIRNLLQNVVKYSDEATDIIITNDADNLYISNQSTGANAEELNRLLLDKKVDSKSFGLGLQIADDLAGAIHTTISFTQNTGQYITAVLHWNA